MKKGLLFSFTYLAIASLSLIAATKEFELDYRYQLSNSSQTETGSTLVSLIDGESATSHQDIEKTILVARLSDTFKQSLEQFSISCEGEVPELPIMMPLKPALIWPVPVPAVDCTGTKVKIADELLVKIADLSAELETATVHDEKIAEALDYLRKLATNMKNFRGFGNQNRFETTMPKSAAIGFGGSLNIATGGAQDYAYVKKTIDDGYVPTADSFDAKGFMSEFDLSINFSCDQLLCINPSYKFDAQKRKLYVQLAMNTNITRENFTQKPLNLALVLDISGSMSATDNTEKTRLDWAKEAAIKTLNSLQSDDYVSVVIFDDKAEVLIPARQIKSNKDKEEAILAIKNLRTRGSTNLYDGLKKGYELVSNNGVTLATYNHRVILISDAGLNTGTTDEASNVRLVSDYAAESIGLSAIGLGLNFNQDFIMGITESLGGNYLFAQSGVDMYRYFESFDFLVTPIANHLKARLSFNNTKAQLVNAYGIPSQAVTKNDDLINVKSLFLTNQGGGAILLEYKLD
jgi:Mg-chelatase subunit ChlD